MAERIANCRIDLKRAHIDGANDRFELRYAEGRVIGLCERIADSDMVVGLLSNGTVRPERLMIKGEDNSPIVYFDDSGNVVASLACPGKSAFLYFEDSVDRHVVGKLTQIALRREPDRRDKLHVATVGDINSSDWQVWWTPLPSRENYIHVRLVPNCVVDEGRKPKMEEAERLAGVFRKLA